MHGVWESPVSTTQGALFRYTIFSPKPRFHTGLTSQYSFATSCKYHRRSDGGIVTDVYTWKPRLACSRVRWRSSSACLFQIMIASFDEFWLLHFWWLQCLNMIESNYLYSFFVAGNHANLRCYRSLFVKLSSCLYDSIWLHHWLQVVWLCKIFEQELAKTCLYIDKSKCTLIIFSMHALWLKTCRMRSAMASYCLYTYSVYLKCQQCRPLPGHLPSQQQSQHQKRAQIRFSLQDCRHEKRPFLGDTL